MTRKELARRMESAELSEWLAHDELTQFEIEEERRKSEMKSKFR